jgi:hypothetical protein
VIIAATVAPASAAPATQFFRTESGAIRCLVGRDRVTCEASKSQTMGFRQAPISHPDSGPGGTHFHLAGVTYFGAFSWTDGTIGGIGPDGTQTDTTLTDGQAYHVWGWTVLPNSDGTRFTNDGTGHGMFVSIDNVSWF